MKTSFVIILAAALLAGCATVPNDAANLPPDLSRFHEVIVAPIQFAPDMVAAMPDADLAALERDLSAALSEGLRPATSADNRAPHALRIEVTVTELNASSPAANLLTTALLFVPLDAGGITFEARYYDGESSQPFDRTTIEHKSTPLELRGSFSRYGHAEKALRDFGTGIGNSFERSGPGSTSGK